MNERGMLWIIPDEHKIIQPLFQKQVGNGISHTTHMVEFVEKYGLNLNVRETDYHEGPCMIAEDGHLVIKSTDNVSQLVFYIPDVITNRQIEFVSENQFAFSNYQLIGGYSLRHLDGEVVWKTLHGMNEIMLEINKKNMAYSTSEIRR